MQQQVQMRQISKSSLHHAANVLCSNALALFFFIFATVKRGATPLPPPPLCPPTCSLLRASYQGAMHAPHSVAVVVVAAVQAKKDEDLRCWLGSTQRWAQKCRQ